MSREREGTNAGEEAQLQPSKNRFNLTRASDMIPGDLTSVTTRAVLRIYGEDSETETVATVALRLLLLKQSHNGSSGWTFDQKNMAANLTPLSALRVSKYPVPAWKGIPNTSIQNKPLMIYHKAFPNASASQIESHLNSIGVVDPQWRYTMYSDTHFHSTTHEVLCIASGSAKCSFGGEQNDGRVEPVLEKGDVVIVPAGVGHRLLHDHGGFQMVGSYPVGKHWDMCYGRAGEEQKVKGIADVEWFSRDPVYGNQGPVLDA